MDDTNILYRHAQYARFKTGVIIKYILAALISILCLLIFSGIFENTHSDESEADKQGKISAGYYKDLIGEDYQAVEAHFRAAGFTDIELIDQDDSGLAFWKDGKVTLISVGGNTSFSSTDYFSPDTKVIISYH